MNFFQQLIDLADEPSAAAQADVDELGEDVGELQESLRRTLTALGERATQYKHLEAEAETLRAEYDAYREKAEAAQNQLQERLREERLMMEELHRTRGSTDEVYARTSEEKIANLERKLDEGANELERATRRCAEAELGREAAEKAKKEEIDAITRRYDGFKEKSKQRQARLEEQLVQVQNDLQVLQAQVASAEAAKVLTELHKISVGEKDEEERDAAPVDEEAGDGGPVCSASASLGDVASATEVRRLQELLVEADRAASEAARRFSERERDLARQVESAEDDVMDLQKKLSESTASADHLRTELSRLQMSVSKAEDRRVGKEQDVLRQVQQLETLTASLKSELSQGQQQLVEVKQKYERELHDCKSKLLASSSSVEESEAHLRQEKERLEALVAEKEAECTELLTLKQTVEATAAASQEDAQTYMRMAADLRSELQRQANTMSDMEEHHLCSQRILSQREDEAQMKEGDRHDLLHQLREKEEQLHDARTKMEEMEVRLMAVTEVAVGADDDALTTAQDALREAQQQINELSETLACKDAQLSMARGKSEQMRRVHQQEIHARDARINELQHQRRTDQPKRTADPADSDPFDRALDEWSETQQTMPTNQRFIRDAIHSAKQLRSGRVSRQVTYIVVGVFSLLVVFMLISGMLTSPVSQSTAMATITEKLMDCQSQLTAATQAQRQTTTSAHG